jgi:hypothetical protein
VVPVTHYSVILRSRLTGAGLTRSSKIADPLLVSIDLRDISFDPA